MKTLLLIAISLSVSILCLAGDLHKITGTVRSGNETLPNASVSVKELEKLVFTNDNGFFSINKIPSGNYEITITGMGFKVWKTQIVISDKDISIDINLEAEDATELDNVIIHGKGAESVSGKLSDISGTAIYAGKKTEVIHLRNLNANLAANNTRQIYGRIAGLNIWDYDRGGLQLGIGGRGLSPSRSSNFNIRQNGYDISADALGYPESYYNPSAEALEKIEIIRGAASLQYGPQFGGLVNFVMKEGRVNKKIEFTTRQTAGSFNFFNSFNSIGGTVAKGKLNYYTFYQYKTGDSWRPNSHYNQHNAYAHVAYQLTKKLKITGQYTFMNYLAQQPGGLTDAQFNEDASVSVRARNWFTVDWNLISLNVDYAINDYTKLNWRNYTLQGSRDALGVLSYINRPDVGGNRDFMSDKYSNFGSELRLIHHYKLLGEKRSSFLIGTRVYKGLTMRKQGDANDGSEADFYYIGPEPNKSSFRFPGNNVAAFAENIFNINKHWSITPGIRFEYIHTKAEGYYYKKNIFIADDKIQETKKNPRSFVLFGLGTSWKFSNGIEAYANISQNYRSINFNDIRLVNTNARVDPNLKDETGYNIDGGIRGNIRNWLYADISMFYLKYNNRIGSIFTTDTSFMTYRLRTNVSDSRNFGMEMLLEGDILKAISRGRSKYKLALFTNLSLINAKYINTKNTAIADKLVENVPPVLFRAGLSFGNPRFNISYQFSYQTKQYSDATNAEQTPTAIDGAIPAFTVMDLSVSYNWRILTLYTGCNNLANSKYFTRRADGYPGPGILPADIRNWYLTLQVKL
jgi:Fe(3+) dicitrate transport protein